MVAIEKANRQTDIGSLGPIPFTSLGWQYATPLSEAPDKRKDTTIRRIAVLTTSRADYGHLYWPLRELDSNPDIDLRLIVVGAHLSPEFGNTIVEIERDGFEIADRIECLLSSDTDVGMAKTIGLTTLSLTDTLSRLRPDLLLLIADRYEMLAPASVALALRIPIAHIEGGEVSEGAIDHAVRNALTMMSHLHFVPTELAAARVAAMGEEAWRIHRVGAPSLDHLRRSKLLDRQQIQQTYAIDFSHPTFVVAYHPVTIESDTTSEADEVFRALEQLKQQIVFCFPNADAGSRQLIDRATTFCESRANAHLFTNLAHIAFWSVLKHASLMIGNSSSGIMETPSLTLPSVNIGKRQQGRQRAANIIDVAPNSAEIVAGVERALSPEFLRTLTGMTNPYGDGHAAEKIAALLGSIELSPRLLEKHAIDPEKLQRIPGR